jgi:putative transposase
VVLWGARRETTKVPKRGHSEEKILRALHQAESGEKVAEICREHGISEVTFYVWKKKDAGLALSELREFRQLRKKTANLSGWWRICRWIGTCCRRSCEKAVRPRHRRELRHWAQAVFEMSERRVSRLLPIQLATLRYLGRRDPQVP